MATLIINISAVLWHSICKKREFSVHLYLRVVLLIHGVMPQKNGTYTSVAVASPNLGYT